METPASNRSRSPARNRSRSPRREVTDVTKEHDFDGLVDDLMKLKNSTFADELNKAYRDLEPYDQLAAMYRILKTMKPGEPLSKKTFDDLLEVAHSIGAHLALKAL